ncbi:MAG: LysE family transporter [Muribaculaceae bacterium]|nr:LysE family transporter [Muribaculaceae bacterium]MBQ2490411.1 LysE family transporter [Muribaculaceae bacterium]MBQ3961051.1 LysE family transporter [Muribaculaceae bacterium]
METVLSIIFGCFAIGVILSAPMGPIGILCIQRTLNKGRESGFQTGIGAAISDLFYCLLTGLGMSIVLDFIEANQSLLQLIGSVVLLIFGIILIKRNPASNMHKPLEEDLEEPKGRLAKFFMKVKKFFLKLTKNDILSGFFFTLCNPAIIFLIIPLFAQFKFPSPDYSWPLIILGYALIVVGAISWWALITYGVNAIRSHFNIRSMWIINLVIGIIILLLSAYGLFMGIKDYFFT